MTSCEIPPYDWQPLLQHLQVQNDHSLFANVAVVPRIELLMTFGELQQNQLGFRV